MRVHACVCMCSNVYVLRSCLCVCISVLNVCISMCVHVSVCACNFATMYIM